MNSVDKSSKLFGKKSGIFQQKFILSSGVPLILFGKESEKERFVVLKLKDFFKLTNFLIKNGNKITLNESTPSKGKEQDDSKE